MHPKLCKLQTTKAQQFTRLLHITTKLAHAGRGRKRFKLLLANGIRTPLRLQPFKLWQVTHSIIKMLANVSLERAALLRLAVAPASSSLVAFTAQKRQKVGVRVVFDHVGFEEILPHYLHIFKVLSSW